MDWRLFLIPSGMVTALLALGGCRAVGPRYQPPSAPVPAAYKEAGNWKPAQPSDQALKGNWWEVFGDAQLDTLETQLTAANQNLKVALEQYLQARALVGLNRADFYPTVTAAPAAERARSSANRPLLPPTASHRAYGDLLVPVSASYEADVWGRVRRGVEAARENAQASAADLASVSLSLHAELASDYFQLRGLDAQKQLLDASVSAYQQALQLTENRFNGGIASEVDVAQARTQLEATRSQDIDVGIARAQFEHAIATLIGQPPASFSLPPNPLTAAPPAVPAGIPSQLLERRPDIAAAERHTAAANAQIGIARATYFPTITLAASGGFESGALANLISGSSAFWALGPAAATQILFEGGRRRAVSQQARAAYEQAVASYRQSTLGAFQEVEDNLAALHYLSDEAATEDAAVVAARRSLELSTNRYRGGVASYLEVTTAQSAALANERAAADILSRRMTATVTLIRALGGGWDRSQLPAMAQLR